MNRSENELPGAKEQNSVEAVLAYHRRTKHHLHHYAASPVYLDWATQPVPPLTSAELAHIVRAAILKGSDHSRGKPYGGNQGFRVGLMMIGASREMVMRTPGRFRHS